MDINQIRYFLNLAQTLNFTEAARLSGISQPSLTKSIQRLEDELGAPVVHRDGKDTRLSELGRDLQVEFMRIRAALDTVTELAENARWGRQRSLSVGIQNTIAAGAFAQFWRKVLDRLPELALNFHPMLPGESEADVLSGKYDLCNLANPPRENFKLAVQPLFEEPLRLALSRHHPLAGEAQVSEQQLATAPYLDRLHCEFRTQLIAHFMDRDIVMRPRLQSEREDWIQQMVAEGLGVCMLPARSAILEGIALRPVRGLSLSRRVSLVSVSGSATPKEVRQIMALAAAHDWGEERAPGGPSKL